jgi:23S rRNA (adenine2503-C2)-methyltransferase
MPTTILGFDTEELRALAQQEGEPVYRGNQLVEWIYRHGAHTFEEMTNLTNTLRTQLSQRYKVGRSRVVTIRQSRNGVLKLLLEACDGARIETVGLPYADRFSCCVSTQVGCPIGCVFCATGQSGYTRNLTAGEIVDQVLAVQEAVQNERLLIDKPSYPIDHVTFMGMGEPLLNYAATLKAIQLLNVELDISMRHITLSTIGFVPGIYSLAKERLQITLAVSLHAPTDDLRQQLIPRTVKWSVAEIIDACRKYIQQTGRRVTFEYCLFDGVNDGDTQARELARLLHGINCHVNLIPYNPVSGIPFHSPPSRRIQAFRKILSAAGIKVTRRVQRGADIDAACGQLRQQMTE